MTEHTSSGDWTLNDPSNKPPYNTEIVIIDFTGLKSWPDDIVETTITYSRIPEFVDLTARIEDRSGHVVRSQNFGSNKPAGSRVFEINSNEKVVLVARDSHDVAPWSLSGRWCLPR